MLPRLIAVITSKPSLFFSHAEDYFRLIETDTQLFVRALMNRVVALCTLVVTALLTVIFGGIAIMLWGVTQQFHWTLVVVPAVFLLAAAISAMVYSGSAPKQSFNSLKAQLRADAQMFRRMTEEGASS
jgi:uncharacterized membrane protein YqjE